MPIYNVCDVDELPVGRVKAFTAGDEKIAVYHLKEGFFATQASCTHMFAPLARGKILDGCRIQCPLHHARFDIRTGKVVDWANFPPGVQLLNVLRGEKALKTFKVKVRDGVIRVIVAKGT